MASFTKRGMTGNLSRANGKLGLDGALIVIRELRKTDLDSVAELWLDTNRKAHAFIPAQHWQGHLAMVKEMLPQAEVYVYEEAEEIQGFIGLSGEYIEGIFVSGKVQSRGIGKLLLDHAKGLKGSLRLSVYQKNARAVRFYQREGFEIHCEGLDESTGEKEYAMTWRRK